MTHRITKQCRMMLSCLLAVLLVIGLFPSITAQAVQLNDYRDPAEYWIASNNRTNELDMVDAKQLAFNPAVELTNLSYDEQRIVFDCMGKYEIRPSLSQAVKLRKLNKAGILTAELIDEILSEAKGQAAQSKPKEEKGLNRFKRFFPAEYTAVQMSEVITKLLTEWKDRAML